MGAPVPSLLALFHRSAWNSNSANFALNLSEKGFEQASERGFGRCSVPKVPIRTLVRPRFRHLQDFSDSFFWGFSEG